MVWHQLGVLTSPIVIIVGDVRNLRICDIVRNHLVAHYFLLISSPRLILALKLFVT